MDCAAAQQSDLNIGEEKMTCLESLSSVTQASITATLKSEPGDLGNGGHTTTHHSDWICRDQEMTDSKYPLLKNSTNNNVKCLSETVSSSDGILSNSLAKISVPSSNKRGRDHDLPRVLRSEERNIFFHPSKKSRFSIDDYSNFRRMCNYGPIPIDWDSPSGIITKATSVSCSDMFDDAEGDETFDTDNLKKYKKTNSSGRISDMLVSAETTHSAAKPISVRPNPFAKSETSTTDKLEKRIVNKKAKKISTDKEKQAAVATLEGEVDLLKILPKEDCMFLGKECFIFTLKQLEWVLNKDESVRDASSRRVARETLTQNLKENLVMFDESETSEGQTAQQKHEGDDGEIRAKKASSFSKDSGVMNIANQVEPNKDYIAAKKLDAWRKSIERWRQGSSQTWDVNQFPLIDGPLSCFFPAGTLQFIESINVKLVFDFLSLKRTESGLVVEMFRDWRKRCGLRDINLLPLSKHLTGIGTRIEEGLKGNLVAGTESSKWVTGAMVVLSGAAKEFLIDHSKIYSGTQFIETRTKNLADQFSEWRAKKGLTALKGSGKVAMVSAWKTQVKEELEIESSKERFVSADSTKQGTEAGSETQTEMVALDNCSGQLHQQSEPRKVEKFIPKMADNSPAVCKALESPEFFSDFFADEQKMNMFKSVGITTAQNFINASKGKNSDLLKALLEMKSRQSNGKQIQVASGVSLLYDWSARIKKRIENLGKDRTNEGPKIRDLDPNPKHDRKPKILPQHSPQIRKSGSSNPFDALSASSKEFLTTSMNIYTAEDFLSTRTTDIANKFVKWRKDRGMTALKGLGAVASISGWKKLVRIKAAALGEAGLAELNIARNTKISIETLNNKSAGPTKSHGSSGSIPTNPEGMFDWEVKQQNEFSVFSPKNDEVFHFRLENRNFQSNERKTYLRYLGNDSVSAIGLEVAPRVNDNGYCVPIEGNLIEKIGKASGRKFFDSNDSGMIELSISHTSHLIVEEKNRDKDITFEDVIESFVLQKKSVCEVSQKQCPGQTIYSTPNKRRASITHDHSCREGLECRKMFNLFEVKRNGEKKSILYLADPIEKGQIIELRCLSMKNFDPSWLEEEDSAGNIRGWIQDRLNSLPVDLLLELVEYLEKKLATPLSRSFESPLMGSASRLTDNKNGFLCSSLTPTKCLVARRRMHWLAVKIDENLQSTRTELALRHLWTNVVWNKEFLDEIRDHLEWKVAESEPVWNEIKQEINYEFTNRGFNGFASTKNLWCPIANQLYDDTVNLFVGVVAKFGDLSIESDAIVGLRSLVSIYISKLKESSIRDPKTQNETDLTKLALTYGEGCCPHSRVFPSFKQIPEMSFIQPSAKATEFCNTPGSAMHSIKEVQLVATRELSRSSKELITRFRDMKLTKISEVCNVDVRWYVNNQILAVVHCVVRSALNIIPVNKTKNYLCTIEPQLMEAAQIALGETDVVIPALEDFEIEKEPPCDAARKNPLSPTPCSAPFFFGFVWPHLRDGGWRLNIGNSTSDISFVQPVAQKIGNRNHHRKVSLTRRRSHYAEETNRIGLGYIPKLTKRLLIQSLKNANEILPERKVDPCPSTKAVLESFRSSIWLNIEVNIEKVDASSNKNGRLKVERIVSEIRSLFDKLIHLTFGKESNSELEEGKQWSDVLDCTHLFRFLLVIPSILQEVNLSFREYQQTVVVVRELVKFLSEKYQEHFPSFIELPQEEYHSEHSFPSRLLSHVMNADKMHFDTELGKPLNYPPSNDRSREVLGPKDRSDLTDFVVVVMSQTVLDKAAHDDKNRSGQPCIVCRHCLGVNGGKYFYGSYESLATATTVVEKHLLRCTKIDNEVKQQVMNARTYHSKQRKKLPPGAQSAFFVRLYNRMQSMAQPCNESEVSSDNSTVSTLQTKEKIFPTRMDTKEMTKETGDNGTTDVSREFKNHLEVMDFIQSTEPWRGDKSLDEMISKYYNCLEYGGNILHTDQSPPVFGSEWLYSKLVS